MPSRSYLISALLTDNLKSSGDIFDFAWVRRLLKIKIWKQSSKLAGLGKHRWYVLGKFLLFVIVGAAHRSKHIHQHPFFGRTTVIRDKSPLRIHEFMHIRNPNRTLIKPEMVNMNKKWKRPAFGDGISAGILDIWKSFELVRIFQPWYKFLVANCEFTSKYFSWLVSLRIEQKQTDERTPTSRFADIYAKLISLKDFYTSTLEKINVEIPSTKDLVLLISQWSLTGI